MSSDTTSMLRVVLEYEDNEYLPFPVLGDNKSCTFSIQVLVSDTSDKCSQ
jgi:hypothetical protein